MDKTAALCDPLYGSGWRDGTKPHRTDVIPYRTVIPGFEVVPGVTRPTEISSRRSLKNPCFTGLPRGYKTGLSPDAGIVRLTANKIALRLRKSGSRLTDRACSTFNRSKKGRLSRRQNLPSRLVRVWLRTGRRTINVTVMTQAHQQAVTTAGDLGRPTFISLPVETDASCGEHVEGNRSK